ncbi:MAG: argininosuccinate synthase [bacterium]|nr:argininosuccinate synthase [bacterium]
MKKKINKIVLAYSGGLDTSIILRWLKETYHCKLVAYVADVGQGDDMAKVRRNALATGADKVIIVNMQEEFVKDYVFPMLRANAIYEAGYMLGTSIARPIIAKKQIEIARKERAEAVSHGATGKGNDQIRFELAYYALNPKIKVIAPWREWEFKGREDLIRYARKYKIPIPITRKKPYSCDRNLFHLSFEGGVLEDPWREPPTDMLQMTLPPEKVTNKTHYLTLDYEKGNPVRLNGKRLSPARLLAKLNEIGGRYGIGLVDIVENRFVGMKSRGVYETPGGAILHKAHRGIEQIVMDREVLHLRDSLIPRYAALVYNGFWFSPEREVLQALMDKAQKNVTGTVRIKLYKGNCVVVGRKSPKSLYDPAVATFEKDSVYNQKDADGFIKLNALRLMKNRGSIK